VERGDRGELSELSGESHTRIIGEEVSLRVSSVLMFAAVGDGGEAAAAGELEAGGVAPSGPPALLADEAVITILGRSKDNISDYNYRRPSKE
jgi:hypothetical protein